mmetsp:Transcript_25232/g.54844  ORF Transcript_25232/g.54844 Transcript_25232/m.54844 type:complete len:290 (-) Transcript_25232:475-1344(-)
MYIEEGLNLCTDVVIAACLVATHGFGVAVHRIADPGDGLPCLANSLDQCWELIPQLLGTHADDHCQATRSVVWVHLGHQRDQITRIHLVTDLDTNGILDSTQKLDVGMVKLPGPLTAPQEVRRAIIPVPTGAVLASEGLLVVQQQALMAGVELSFTHQRAGRVHTAGNHELNCLIHALGQVQVGLTLRAVLHELQVPLADPSQSTIAAIREAPEQVQSGSRLIVSTDQAEGVRNACVSGELRPVDDISTVGRQFHITNLLHISRARLGELASNAAQLHNWDTTTKSQHH